MYQRHIAKSEPGRAKDHPKVGCALYTNKDLVKHPIVLIETVKCSIKADSWPSCAQPTYEFGIILCCLAHMVKLSCVV